MFYKVCLKVNYAVNLGYLGRKFCSADNFVWLRTSHYVRRSEESERLS